MTREEAAEEILRGAYTSCARCLGTGIGPPAQIMSGHCKSCKGSGKWRRGDYVTACFLLDIAVPPIPEKPFYMVWSNKYWPKAASDVEIQLEYDKMTGVRCADWSGFNLDDT